MIPPEHLQLTLADLLLLHGAQVDNRRPVAVSSVVSALRHLDRRLAAEARSREAEQREWLAQQFEALTTY